MSTALLALTGLVLSAGSAFAATPVAIRTAKRLEFFDKPAGYKGHAAPTPYLGGAAVVFAFSLSLLTLAGHLDRTVPLVAATLALWVVGTCDDRFNLSPWIRLATEVVLAAVLWSIGLGWDLGYGALLDILVTVFWIAAVVNAFNLFDNMDGAASSMAAVVAGGLVILGTLHGNVWLAVASASLCGACLGFLPGNLTRPAKVFLGDGGSMPVGFAIAALVMIGVSDETREWQALAMGLLFVGIPALDTALVVISRGRRGIPILSGGQDHLTHRMRHRLQTASAVAASLGGAQALLAVLALVTVGSGSAALVFAVVAYLTVACVIIARLDRGYSRPPTATADQLTRRRRVLPGSLAVTARQAASAGLGICAGASAFFEGFYESELWAPIGLGLVASVTAMAMARPVRMTTQGHLVVGGLSGLTCVSFASILWAESPSQAFVYGNRLVVSAAVLVTGILLLRSWADGWRMLGGIVVGTLGVGVYVIARLLLGDDSTLLADGRLVQPLGYVNGQGLVFVMALFPCLAMAERARDLRLQGLAAFIAVFFGGLAMLSLSRGAFLGTALGLLVAALALPGRIRRATFYLALLAPLLPLAPMILGIPAGAEPSPGAQRSAALGILLAALLGSAVPWVWRMTSRRMAPVAVPRWSGLSWRWRSAASVVVVLLAAAVAPALRDRAQEGYDSFVSQPAQAGGVASPSSSSRLVAGQSNRAEYWRVSLKAWQQEPLGGVGAGGFTVPWYQERRVLEDIRQPHSLAFQTLSELGLIGIAPLIVLIAGLLWGAAHLVKRIRPDDPHAPAVAASMGISVAWLVQANVDWVHLFPGLTAVALLAVALLVMPARVSPVSERAEAPQRPLLRTVRATLFAAILAFCALSLSRQVLSEYYRRSAQSALTSDPAEALDRAHRSLAIAPQNVSAEYIRSGALARLGDEGAARRALVEAVRQEPHNYVTWTLLGGLEQRVGNVTAARRDYATASRLNPLDVYLRVQAGGKR
jgi:UDP-GlcNAc:undecaprenyl-phosphate GlcNAc-1-phosphate transferase